MNPFYENDKLTKCTECTEGHYVGDDFCTDFGKEFDWEAEGAPDFVDITGDCESVIDGDCTECSENHYKNNGVCCAIGEFNTG